METYRHQSLDLPYSVYPNNWSSTHRSEDIQGGLFVLYPMREPSRDREKNPEIIQREGAKHKHSLEVEQKKQDQALEGNGTLLFDVENKKIFCNVSVRADEALLEKLLTDF